MSVAHEIEMATKEMHDAVEKALDKFSGKTGMPVRCISFSVTTALAVNGRIADASYHSFESDVVLT